jgi:tellurite resistance protein TerC
LFVRARDTERDNRPAAPPLMHRWYATPMVAVLVAIELTDIIFAFDSIPAIFGVTREPFIVFAATAFALVGLRSMYFLLAGARDRFVHLDKGLAVILMVIGAEFLLSDVVHVDPGVSLVLIVVIMAAAIGASLRRPLADRESLV